MPRRSGRRRRRYVLVVLLVALAVVLALGAVMAWQGWRAVQSGQQARGDLETFREQLLTRDLDGARASLAEAQERSATARSSLSGPWWAAASKLPGVGADVDAARRLSVVVDDVTQGALPAALTALVFTDPARVGFDDGRIELGPLRDASEQLTRSASLLREARDDASAIETSGVSPSVGDQVREVQQQLARTSRLATNAAVAAELLPGMLGEGEPRDYLVMAQNNAEQRSLGGLVGAVVQLRAEDGRLTLVRQASNAEIGNFEQPVLPLTDAEEILFGPFLARFPGNVTASPDFPRAAELLTTMWERRIGGQVDGVASIDPYALQLLLQVVGPVNTDAGRITGRNAARQLLVGVYDDIDDPAQQNVVFAQAAATVFDAVQGFDGDPRDLVAALARGVDEGRVMLWSAHDEEEKVLAGTALGRTLSSTGASRPQVGVYLQDLTQSKMSTYQRVRIDVAPDGCRGATSASATVRLRSVAPADRSLPEYVTGNGFRVPPGDIATRVVVYTPEGWTVSGFKGSGGLENAVTFEEGGMSASYRDFTLEPGQTKSFQVDMAGPAVNGPWSVRYTPGNTPASVRGDVPGC